MNQSQIDLWPLSVQASVSTSFGLLPKLGQCPWQVIRCLWSGASNPIGRQAFSSTYNWPHLAAEVQTRRAICNAPGE